MADRAVRTSLVPARLEGPLFGRAAEVDLVEEVLGGDDGALVTITGPIGVGKSALAAEVMRRLVARDLSVVAVHVGLAGLHNAALVSDAICASLDPQGEATTPAQALSRKAEGAPALLVLDDADEADGLPGLVLDLLEAYAPLQVVVTRMRPLHAPGERVVAIKPLQTSDVDDGPSVELFAARAEAADAGFVLDEHTRPAVAQLCRLLRGLPLAIETAAARVTTVPPALMARQIGRSLELLHLDGPGVPERHRSVEAALDWSMGLLSDDAASVLAQLSVFAGVVPLRGAEFVVRPRRAQTELLEVLFELIDCHLVDLDASDPDALQVALDPLVRRRARQRLAESEDEARVLDAHSDFWATECAVDPARASQSWPDVVAALDRRITTGRHDEALQMAATAASMAGTAGAQDSLMPLVEAILGDGSVSDEATVARTAMWAATHTPVEGASVAAYGAATARRLRESIAIARASGDDAALLGALEFSVNSLGVTFDLEGAVASAYEGLALAGRLGDEPALARFEVWTAMAQNYAGDAAAFARSARSAYERGLRVGDDVAVVYAALMLHGLPVEDQGALPLLDLDDLLRRAERLAQPVLIMHVLSSMTLRSLMSDGVDAPRLIGRMLLLADGLQRTWPLASVGPLMLSVSLALSRGAVEDAVLIRGCLADLEQLLPEIVPTLGRAYLELVQPLATMVEPARYAELFEQTHGLSLPQANRLAQAMVRSYVPADAAAARIEPGPQGRGAADAVGTRTEALTPRESEVLAALVRGGTNREIADTLGVSPKTVMHHTVAIYRKLNVRGRTEAVAWAVRTGTVRIT